jgi:MoaA/NifB/PqqE/SkfB family radical SAM enzyme
MVAFAHVNGPFQLALSWGDFLLRRKLKHLIVHVTNHCNFRCHHCFVDFDGTVPAWDGQAPESELASDGGALISADRLRPSSKAKAPVASAKRDLPKETYFKLAEDAGSLFWLDIGGGEPFIRKDLAEIIGAFRCKIVHIPSNGSLLPQMSKQLREMRRLQPQADLLIGLSLDGLEETHDRLRRQPGNFAQVWKTFEAIRELDPRINIKITTVITNKNFSELPALMRLVLERGADFHSVILLRGTPPSPDVTLPPLDELRRFGPEMFSILKKYKYGQSPVSAHILRNYHRYLWNVSLDVLERHTQVIPCYAGRSHMVVWGDGSVSACEMLGSVGNLGHQRFRDVLAGDAMRAQVKSIRNKECHCTHNCAMLTSILFNPASLPHLVHQPIRT